MSETTPNLFDALFALHPSEGLVPKENFLSEAFAYVLATSVPAQEAWISLVLGKSVAADRCKVSTRNSELEGERCVFPDMKVEVEFEERSPITIYSEHKWHSPCNDYQLATYLRVARGQPVVFIGAHRRQKLEAQRTLASDRCFLWEEVYTKLDSVAEKSEVLEQFLGFMKTHGLSPGEPLSTVGLVALVEAPKAKQGLLRAINRLSEMDWAVVPKRYRAKPEISKEKWGATSLIFATQGWSPTVSLGFLFDPTDHGVSLTDARRGIDLCLRVQSHPSHLTADKIQAALLVLSAKRQTLRQHSGSALLVREPGNRNPHSLMLIQKCLADVLDGAQAEAEQHRVIYETLSCWLETLFADGSLESALFASGLCGGELATSAVTPSPPASATPTPEPAGE